MKFLESYSSYLYATMRVVAGFLFACHGAQKLLGVLGGFRGSPGATAPLFSMIGLAGVIELVGGLLLMLGLFTRVAAFLASGEMAVAYFMAHFPRGFWPIQNNGELAVLYCFVFLYIAARGPMICALDLTIWKGVRGPDTT
jgi:putative oxidoreductase